MRIRLANGLSLALVVAVALAFGACGRTSRRSPTSVGANIVQTVMHEAPQPVSECSDEACLRAAFAGCRPAHRATSYATFEAEPVFVDYFVLPRTGACKVVVIDDGSKAYYAGCRIGRRECPTLDAAMSDDPDGGGCTVREVLHTEPRCERVTGFKAFLRDLRQ